MEKVFPPFTRLVWCSWIGKLHVSRVSSKQEIIGSLVEFSVGDFFKCLVKIQMI